MSRTSIAGLAILVLLLFGSLLEAAEPDQIAVVFTDGRRAHGRLTGFKNGKFRFELIVNGKQETYTFDQSEIREIIFAQEPPDGTFRPPTTVPKPIDEVGVTDLRRLFARQLESYSRPEQIETLLDIIIGWAADTGDERQPLTLLRPLRRAARTPADRLHVDLMIYAAYKHAGQDQMARQFKQEYLSERRVGPRSRLLDHIEQSGVAKQAAAQLAEHVRSLGKLKSTQTAARDNGDQKQPPKAVKPKLEAAGEKFVDVTIEHVKAGLRNPGSDMLQEALMLAMGVSFRVEWGTERMIYELKRLRQEHAQNPELAGILDVMIYAVYLRGGPSHRALGGKYREARPLDQQNKAAVELNALVYQTDATNLLHKANVIFLKNNCPPLPTKEPKRHEAQRQAAREAAAARKADAGKDDKKGKGKDYEGDGESRRSRVIKIEDWGK